MKSKFTRRITSGIVFSAGLFLMILGITFLLASTGRSSKMSVFFAFLLVVAGAICAVVAIRLSKRSIYLFFASLFLMAGIFILLSILGIIPLPVARAWPLLSVFSGLALLPVGWRRCGGFSKRYFVSSIAFVVLGGFLLVFSLRMVPISFRQFIYTYWPLLLIIGGITLALTSLVARSNSGENPEKNSGAEEQEE